MAATPPSTTQRKTGGVFLRVRPGLHEAIIVRPMNAKAGDKFMPVSRLTQAETLEIVRIWRKQTGSLPPPPRPEPAGPQLVVSVGKKKNHHGR